MICYVQHLTRPYNGLYLLSRDSVSADTGALHSSCGQCSLFSRGGRSSSVCVFSESLCCEASQDARQGTQTQRHAQVFEMAQLYVLQLDRAIKTGDVASIEHVLDQGASPDGDKNAGKKPIHFAVETGLVRITELLCERGAILNVANPEEHGRSPLHMAVIRGYNDVVKYLLERSADPNLVDGAGETPLITAIQKGEFSSVALLLKYGADVHIRDANHNTALLIALEKNHAEIVQMLLSEGAKVFNRNLSGDSTIHVAARKCSSWVLEMLREKGCNLDKCNRDGSFPLHLAAESGNLEAVQWLLHQGANSDELDASGRTPAGRAADARQKHVVDWFNDHKGINELTNSANQRAEIRANAERGRQAHLNSNIDFDDWTSATSSSSGQTQDGQRPGNEGGRVVNSSLGLPKVHGKSSADQREAERKLAPILEASRKGDAETVKRLLQNKADLEVADQEGRRPLHLAALGGHDRVVKELLRGGATVSAKSPEGLCCVHYAAQGGHISTLMLLLESHCDIHALTKDGSTALHLAAAHGHSSAVEWLVAQAGLKVASANKKQETALGLARKAGHKAVVQSLLQVQISDILVGGDVGTLSQLVEECDLDDLCAKENDKGFRSVHYAACGGDVEVLKILQNKMYDMNSVTNQGYSALHYAVKYSHLAAVKWLVKKAGLDATLLPCRGVASALTLARRKGHAEIVTFLEKVTTVKSLESGDFEALRDLVHEGVNADAVCEGKFGIPVAHFAAKLGHLALLKNLQELKYDVKAVGDAGLTALHFAANYGQLEAVKWLVEEAGLDVSLRNREGLTALSYAEKCSYEEIVAYLRQIAKGEGVGGGGRGAEGKAESATVGGTSMELRSSKTLKLLKMAQRGDAEGVRRLAEDGVNLEAESSLPDQKGLRALHLASIAGHARAVQELVRGGAEVNARSAEGISAIHYAAAGGHSEIIGILKAAECDLNAVTSAGDSALHLAVHSSNLLTVKSLVKSGVDIVRGNRKGLTPLDIAVKVQKADIANYLVEVCVERALASEDTGSLVQLLQKGAELDHLIVQRSKEGMRAVHYAARHGSLEMLKLLKERNTDMTSTSVMGHTALHWAARGGHLDAARWLVSHGGLDATCRSKDGATALDVALGLRNAEVAGFLKEITRVGGLGNYGSIARQPHDNVVIIEREVEAGAAAAAAEAGGGGGAVERTGVGATAGRGVARTIGQDLNKTDKASAQEAFQKGDLKKVRELITGGFDANAVFQEKKNKECRPLHLAADGGHEEIVRFLLHSGSDTEATNYEGMTPLHLASWGGHAEVIKVLLQKGANGNARTNEGMTAIHLASMGGHVSSMEALAPTCDILSVARDGKSALHLAAEYGNLGAVQWLHLQGLATSLKDHSGQTPLQYAKDEGHKKVMDFLKRLDQQTLNQRRVKQRSPEALAQRAGSRNEEAARKPLDHRANPERPGDLEGRKGSPDLHTAASVGHVNVMRDLLKAGAPKDTMDRTGLQAVHYAAKGGHIEALKLLKESECDLTTRTPRGATTLHCAAEGGHVAAVQWLLEHSGLGLDSLNNDGETALDVARRNGHHNTIVHLLEARHQRDVKKLQYEMKEKEFEITKLAADLKVKEELRKEEIKKLQAMLKSKDEEIERLSKSVKRKGNRQRESKKKDSSE